MTLKNYDWMLVGCHHISEVAVAYFTNYASNRSAVEAFRRSINETPGLLEELTNEDYSPKTIHLTPVQIAVIVRHWGFPSCVGEMIEKNPYLAVPKIHGKI